jgi:hypothetical protein
MPTIQTIIEGAPIQINIEGAPIQSIVESAPIQIEISGARGLTGPAGASGGSTNAWKYKAKTNATSGYPTNGHLLWNNATQTSATSIIVSHLTDDDTDIELFLSFFVLNQKIFIQNRDDSSQNQVWQITGTPTVTGANTATAYYTFPVTLVSSAGAAFTNNHSILFGQIVVATNAVTSATTSDGTCALSVFSVSVTDSVILPPQDDGFGNTVTFQILSVPPSGDLGGNVQSLIQAPYSGGYISVTNDEFGIPDKLTNGTIAGTLAINSTTITYGTGAASAHRTALGLNSAASLTNTDLERSINANSLNFMPPVTFFDDMDGNYAYTASNIGAGGSGPADFSSFGSRTHGVYGIRTLATISAGRIMSARITSSAGYVAGARFRACFAISDVTNCNFFAGFSWVGTSLSGLVYRSAFNSGQFVFARVMNADYTGGTFYTFTTEVPQAGAFTSGKRYIVDLTMETLTSCRIKLYIADFNLSNWTEIANSVVTLPSTLVNVAPTFSVQTTDAAIKTLWVDWVSVEQPSFIR